MKARRTGEGELEIYQNGVQRNTHPGHKDIRWHADRIHGDPPEEPGDMVDTLRDMGADEPQGHGWWIASDGKWYPPELHPNERHRQADASGLDSAHAATATQTALVAVDTSDDLTIIPDAPVDTAAPSNGTRVGPSELPAERGARSAPRWETDARDAIATALRRYAKPLGDLVARDANEGDTRLFVTDFLCDALGFDKYEDLTTEYQVKGEYADYGVRIDKQLVAFIEVKRCTTKLGEKHLRQVQSYAVNEGVEWLMLTNGQVWQVWHLTGGLPVAMDLVIDVDLLRPDGSAAKVEGLFHITKSALKRQTIASVWQTKKATSPGSIARAVLSAPVLDAIRKEVRRQTDHNPTVAEIEQVLRTGVLRSDCC